MVWEDDCDLLLATAGNSRGRRTGGNKTGVKRNQFANCAETEVSELEDCVQTNL